jgi:uncharacterized protein YkvS
VCCIHLRATAKLCVGVRCSKATGLLRWWKIEEAGRVREIRKGMLAGIEKVVESSTILDLRLEYWIYWIYV